MRRCRFDAGAGGYLARETETETGAEAARARRRPSCRSGLPPGGPTARSAIIRTPSELIVHARLVRNVG
jgi:hypothetical protein